MGSPQSEWELVKESGFVPLPRVVLDALTREAVSRGKLSIIRVGLAIIEETLGWKNRDGEGRQLLAHISLSRFQQLTRLSRPTIIDALSEIEQIPIFRRVGSQNRRWARWQYGVDFDWLAREMGDVEGSREFISEGNGAVNSVDLSSKASLPLPDQITSPASVNSVAPTKRLSKETTKERDERNDSFSDRILRNWPEIVKEMAAQTTASTFNHSLRALRPLPTGNGQLILQAASAYEAGWVRNRLWRVVLLALQSVVPEIEAQQVVIVAPGQDADGAPLESLVLAGDWSSQATERSAEGG